MVSKAGTWGVAGSAVPVFVPSGLGPPGCGPFDFRPRGFGPLPRLGPSHFSLSHFSVPTKRNSTNPALMLIRTLLFVRAAYW